MKRLAFFAVVLGLGFFPSCSHAQGEPKSTGLDLMNQCQPVTRTPMNLTGAEIPDAEWCMGYILGMKDMLTIWHVESRGRGDESEVPFCVPHEATVAELVRVMIKFLNDNPTELHTQEAVVIYRAFRKAYPCSNQSK